MEIDDYIQQIIEDKPVADTPLEDAPTLVKRLREEADRYARIDPQISLRLADTILEIGNYTEDTQTIALGKMSRGDVLWHLHQNDEAWELLHEAGELYQQLGDEVGWARTRVGRLAICVEMDAIIAGLEDAEAARIIFLTHHEFHRLIRLETNVAALFNHLANYPAVIKKCATALQLVQLHAKDDDNALIILCINMGYALQGLGQLKEALHYYKHARTLMVTKDEKLGVPLADLFIINVIQAQGQNKKALRLLHETIDVLSQHQVIETSKETWHLSQRSKDDQHDDRINGYEQTNRLHADRRTTWQA